MYTACEIEAGAGCYRDRSTYLYCDANGRVYTTDSKNAHITGAYFCGRRDPDGAVTWC